MGDVVLEQGQTQLNPGGAVQSVRVVPHHMNVLELDQKDEEGGNGN
jgi:hypothetical protein